MFIHQAVQKRTREKPFIRREAWSFGVKGIPASEIKLFPTDTPDNCIMIGNASRYPCRGWQPSAADLAADDWEICS